VIAETNFSEEIKANVLNQTAVVWNPKTYTIAQSGVTVDALRYGCQIVLTEGDPECHGLHSEGIAIHLDDDATIDLDALDDSTRTTATELFAARHGENAFTSHYLPLFDGSASS